MVEKEEAVNISVAVVLPLFKDSKIVSLAGIREKHKSSHLYLPYFYYNHDFLQINQSIEQSSYHYIQEITNLNLDIHSFKIITSKPYLSKKENRTELCMFVMYKKQIAVDAMNEFNSLEEHEWTYIKAIDHIHHEAHEEVAKEFLKIYS
jgi:hypothetical protein